MQVVIKVRFRLAIRRDPVPRGVRVFARGGTIRMQREREREKGERRKKRGGTRLPLHVYGICNSSGTLWFERRVSPVLRRAKKRRFRSGALTPRELLRGGDRFDGGLLVPFCFDPRDSCAFAESAPLWNCAWFAFFQGLTWFSYGENGRIDEGNFLVRSYGRDEII